MGDKSGKTALAGLHLPLERAAREGACRELQCGGGVVHIGKRALGHRSDELTDMEGVEERGMEMNRPICTVQGPARAEDAWRPFDSVVKSAITSTDEFEHRATGLVHNLRSVRCTFPMSLDKHRSEGRP